ncbi:MAG: glycosyltransferase [Clostridia bacterium]|nr:glycosyltransferase [Clostridia bacterium]
MDKIKVLQIVPSLSLSNGVAAYLMNYYQKMDFSRFDTTILVLNDDNKGRYEAFEKCGCKIVELIKNESWGKYLKRINIFFKENHFDIVHCHAPNYGAFYMHYAKKNGVKIRILHSHANKYADTKINAIRNYLLFKIAVKKSNYYLACSNEAGKFLFGKKHFEIMNNAIDFAKYKFNVEKREELRKELNIAESFVIGEVGRFCPQKNQLFTIDIFNEIHKIKEDSKLILIGGGDLEEKINNKIKEYSLGDSAIVLGSKPNAYDYYNCFDAFLLPSTYEGLGIVLIEAQVNGLPSYTSIDRVPKLAKICPLLKFLDLDKGAKFWADYILNDKENTRKDYDEEINNSDFNIEKEAKKLEEYYLSFA